MKTFAKYAAAAVLVLGVSSVSAYAACDGDTGTETVLGAGSGAVVGGLASHSIVGAAVGGVVGGVIGNSIGHANNREDCRREADYYREREGAYNAPPPDYRPDYREGAHTAPPPDGAYNAPPPDYVDRNGNRVYDDK